MLRSGITWKEAESVELWYRIGGGVAENQLPPLRKFRNRRKFYTSDDSSDVGCSSNEDDEEDDDSQTLMMAAAVWIFKMTENFCCFVFSFVYYLCSFVKFCWFCLRLYLVLRTFYLLCNRFVVFFISLLPKCLVECSSVPVAFVACQIGW